VTIAREIGTKIATVSKSAVMKKVLPATTSVSASRKIAAKVMGTKGQKLKKRATPSHLELASGLFSRDLLTGPVDRQGLFPVGHRIENIDSADCINGCETEHQ